MSRYLFMTLLPILFLTVDASALNKKPIEGQDALDIVAALNSIGVVGDRLGSSDTGYVNIRSYKILGMECVAGMSAYGGYGSQLEGTCYFEGVKSKSDLTKLRSILKSAGLKSSNGIFEKRKTSDIRADKTFVATCPEQYLTYLDKSERGPGAYCACPEENINYIDKAEGGPGHYCAP